MTRRERTLAHIRDALREIEAPATSREEVERAAQHLGVADWLPDPQEELELPRAA